MNYFDLEQYIINLIDVGDVAEHELDNDRVYTLNSSGEETIGFFDSKIPYSIREKLLEQISIVNDESDNSNEVAADCYPVNEREYGGVLNIKENNVTMLNLDVYMGDKDAAKKVAHYFASNVNDVYKKILEIIKDATESDK